MKDTKQGAHTLRITKVPKTKSKNTKNPSPRIETFAAGDVPRGMTLTTPSGIKVTRFTLGEFIEFNPGPGCHKPVTISANGNPSFNATSFFLGQIPTSVKKIDVYTDPIPSTWGTKKLAAFCKAEFGLETTQGRAFLFFNKKRDLLRVYWHDGACEQLIERVLFEGVFLVPLTGDGSPWMQVPRDNLPNILKSNPASQSTLKRSKPQRR